MTPDSPNPALPATVSSLQARIDVLQAALDRMAQGVLVMAADGRIKLFNQRVCEILQLPPEFLSRGPMLCELVDLQHQRGDFGPGHEWVQPGARAYVASRGVQVDDTIPTRYTRNTRDGRCIEVTSLVMENGDYVRTYADVTGYQRERERAERAAVEKAHFLAIMSHELRTPLSAILGLNQLLMQTALDHMQKDYVRRADSAGALMLEVLNDVLDFSKANEGKLRIAAKAFRLADVIREQEDFLVSAAKLKGLTLKVAIDPALDTEVRGDPLRLKQVLLNLIGNALKFTERGHVHVTAKLNKTEAVKIWVEFSVEDTGIGIAAENTVRIFDKYEQLGEMTPSSMDGTGLGLFISKQLVELMGGRLQVRSEIGKGTCFTFVLPFESTFEMRPEPGSEVVSPAMAAVSPAKPTPKMAGVRVLAVDDNDDNRLLVKLFLSKEGCQVTLCQDAQTAIDALQQSPTGFDAVLMDVQMPGMDGLAATRAIRQMAGLDTLPIIGMTANLFEEDRQACLAAGMNWYVGKPFKLEDLIQALSLLVPRR